MKDLDYYMALPYKMQVEELTDYEGGGLILSIPILGSSAVRVHEYTYSEARAKLEQIKRDFLTIWLEAGLDIPEPQPDAGLESVKMLLHELGLV